MTTRLTLAMPSKGRLREPAWNLLEASGVSPQEPGERVLQTYCRNADIDLLFVRADDVPEYVQDGVVDCGITGRDLVEEGNYDVEVLLNLGFGFCSLQVAVPNESSASSLKDLNGLRIATSHPVLAQRALDAAGISAELISVGGSVEIAPRLGLAEAIIDLVSTGSTLKTNGLRSIQVIFESEAVVIGRRGASGSQNRNTLITMLQSVIEARTMRYLLFNVPTKELAAVVAELPTSGSPSVLTLADPDVVAVHALVPASDIWSLLPKLESKGASSILTLPIERMVR